MTRLLISTAVAGLLALGGAAMAQPDDHRDQAGHAQDARPAAAPSGHADGGHAGGHDQQRHDDHNSAPRQDNAMRGPGAGHDTRGPAPGNAMRGPAPGNAMRGPGGAPGQHRDYSSFHRNFSAPHHFRAPSAYNRPNGWYAHRWSYGEVLPSLFWSQNYWLSDFDDYGLMSPPPGTVWVRDGSDALLIDQYSGEIIQVEYGIFY